MSFVIGAGLLTFSAVMQEQGRKKSLRDQAKIEEANALFFAEQQRLTEFASRREIGIFDDQSETFIADKVSMIAQAGVDLSGNMLSILANESAKIASEHNAIIMQNEFKVRLLELKQQGAQASAQAMRDSADSNLPLLGSFLGITGQAAIASASPGSPDPGEGIVPRGKGLSSGSGGSGIGSGSLPSDQGMGFGSAGNRLDLGGDFNFDNDFDL